ncbi:uncharacterized protein LOC141613108 [Silene latifolia]|uniref:uncharacterized protein LOC141613108 n=1 Tax=Silene latifolia TaxID=37657 RepID=UPI003D77398D
MEDYLFWNASSTGLYSVKKGYGIAHQQLWDLYASPKDLSRLGVLHTNFIKSRLWQLPGPKVWTILIWKILTDTLPIGIEFQKRELSHVCLGCCLGESCEAVETMEHLFRDCEVAKRLWMGSHLGIRTENVGSLDVKGWIINWFLYLIKQDDNNRGVLSFMCSLWTIWKVRSHNAFSESKCNAVGAMRIYEVQFNLTMAAEKRFPDQKPPGFGYFTSEDSLQDIGRRLKKGDELMLYGGISSCPKHFICVDASWTEQRKSGLGWVCFSPNRNVTQIQKSTFAQSVEQAEGMAILEALLWAINNKLLHVYVGSDCLQILQQIMDGKAKNHLTTALIKDIIHVASSFHCISFSYIPRSCNNIAHNLANRARI